MILLILKKKRRPLLKLDDEEQICSLLVFKLQLMQKVSRRMTRQQTLVKRSLMKIINLGPALRDARTFFVAELSRTGRAKHS